MTTPPHEKLLAPLEFLYGAIVRARGALYERGVFKTTHVLAPVLSVGNITTGGTGKTPLVAHLARIVAETGARPCILTRGYGRENSKSSVIVRDGEKILTDARTGGDEPLLLAETLNDTSTVIIADANRIRAAHRALEDFGACVFLLDDGFQHRKIARNLDIVTVDATDPFGGGHLLPRARLREPPASLRRADAIVITRAEQVANEETLLKLVSELKRLCEGRAQIFTSRLRTIRLRPLNEAAHNFSSANDEPFAAFCAIGNAENFFAHLRRENFKLTHTQRFRDHHAYTQSDTDAFAHEATQSGARALLTTAKDAVKLCGFSIALPCYAVDVELTFDDEARLREFVQQAIKS